MTRHQIVNEIHGIISDIEEVDSELQSALADHTADACEDNLTKVHIAAYRLQMLSSSLQEMQSMETRCRFYDPNYHSSLFEIFHISTLTQRIAHLKGIRISIDFDEPKDLPLKGCIEKYQTIFAKILEHCVDHTTQGTILVQVRSTDKNGEDKVQVTVTDTSVGLTDLQINSIYAKHTCISKREAQLPSRYSLEVAERHLQDLGQSIRCQSNVGVGTSFRFEFPVVLLKSSNLEHSPKTAEAVKVLVVEDNEIAAEVVLKKLGRIGVQARTVANGNRCLEILKQEHFDIILMDCHMPGMDGFETTEEIRLSHHKANYFIVALTADAMPGIQEHCLEAGMNAYQSKPLNNESLAKIVADFHSFRSPLSKVN